MHELDLFEAVIEPSVERIPLVDIRYRDVVDGRECEISHLVYRNVFTEFDQKLSRHLAAVSQRGFPAISATIRIRAAKSRATWRDGKTLHFHSVPHALRGIASRALKDQEKVHLAVHTPDDGMGAMDDAGVERVVAPGDVQALNAALDLCAQLGEFEFLDLSGDFDLIMVQPKAAELRPVTMDLYRGSVTVPEAFGDAKDGFEGPLFDFRKLIVEHPQVRTYIAAARHGLAACKESAVMTFRSAAEARILNFDRALAGRPLADYRLDAVVSLVARLKAGLGDNLAGLSEDAQITALDWASSIEHGSDGGSRPDDPTTLEFVLRGSRRAAS
jgi:hypothetical protein